MSSYSRYKETVSFKEERNLVAELSDLEKKALDEFKELIVVWLAASEFNLSPPPPKAKTGAAAEVTKTEAHAKEEANLGELIVKDPKVEELTEPKAKAKAVAKEPTGLRRPSRPNQRTPTKKSLWYPRRAPRQLGPPKDFCRYFSGWILVHHLRELWWRNDDKFSRDFNCSFFVCGFNYTIMWLHSMFQLSNINHTCFL